MRRVIAFACIGDTLVGTLDEGGGDTGLLIVSGGNEIRAGAHRGMASLADRLAATGLPVFRYDRRGVGDSSGANRGFAEGRDDLLAAADAFRSAAGIAHVVAFGNCDAASLLALHGREAGIDRAILANPWVVVPTGDLPPPAAIRARYAQRLRDPSSWRRMAMGGVSIVKLIKGMARIVSQRGEEGDGLATRVLAAIHGWGQAATIVLAAEDATAIAYADAARRADVAPRTITIDTASHSFARAADAAALEAAIRAIIANG